MIINNTRRHAKHQKRDALLVALPPRATLPFVLEVVFRYKARRFDVVF
jgi:hypothetical protein